MSTLMEKKICYLCQKPKATLDCGICSEAICKSCTRFLDEDSFSFLKKVPQKLSHTTYCEPCFHSDVEPQFENYNRTLETAKNIAVFMKNQGKETRLIKRLEEPVQVVNCADHDETLLRLAFFAAEKGYNAIIDVELKSEKVRNGSYQTSSWTGTAVPTQVDDAKLMKDRSIWSNPN